VKDSEVRGLVLKALYDIRNKPRGHTIQIPEGLNIPGFELSSEDSLHLLGNVAKQLGELGLIEFHQVVNRRHPSGLAWIKAPGVDVVEGTASAPVTITFDNSVRVTGSQGVQIGGQGNVQKISMDAAKLINAIDGGAGTIQEKEEAKSLLKKLVENPLIKAALELWAKSHGA
jgi:hypothetical protein